jgi:hypothetical protein
MLLHRHVVIINSFIDSSRSKPCIISLSPTLRRPATRQLLHGGGPILLPIIRRLPPKEATRHPGVWTPTTGYIMSLLVVQAIWRFSLEYSISFNTRHIALTQCTCVPTRLKWAKMSKIESCRKMLIIYNDLGEDLTTQKTKELFQWNPYSSRYGNRFTAIFRFCNETMTMSRRICL